MRVFNQRLLACAVAVAALVVGACSGDARITGLANAPAGTVEPTMNGSAGSRPTGSPSSPPSGREPGTGDAGAGGSGPLQPVATVPFSAPRGGCDVAERVGGFSVEAQVDFGVVQGAVAEGVVPTAIPRVVLQQAGCQLLERRNLACSPACVGAETCGESGSCIPYPRQVSVGDVNISGLTRQTTMSPLPPGNTYFAPGADNPPYEVDGEVVLSAQGTGETPSFQLFGIGSEPLTEAPTWVLEAGTDLGLAWAAPTSSAKTTVLVELTIDQHGISPLSLACELEDTGSAVIPAPLVQQLMSAGISGFPNGRITRRTADHVELDVGCLELVVGSPRAASVEVSGYTPCNRPSDCPTPQTCNLPLQRCE